MPQPKQTYIPVPTDNNGLIKQKTYTCQTCYTNNVLTGRIPIHFNPQERFPDKKMNWSETNNWRNQIARQVLSVQSHARGSTQLLPRDSQWVHTWQPLPPSSLLLSSNGIHPQTALHQELRTATTPSHTLASPPSCDRHQQTQEATVYLKLFRPQYLTRVMGTDTAIDTARAHRSGVVCNPSQSSCQTYNTVL